MNAPVMVVVKHGSEQRIEWYNAFARKALGERDLTGKTPLEAFPELEQWARTVDATVASGQAYVGVEEPITIDWSGTGKLETRYLTAVCQPLRAEDGTIDGSLVLAIDVTASVREREAPERGQRAWRVDRGGAPQHRDSCLARRSGDTPDAIRECRRAKTVARPVAERLDGS